MTATYEKSQIRLQPYPVDEKLEVEYDELVNRVEMTDSSHPRCAAERCCESKRRRAFVFSMVASVTALLALVWFIGMAILCPEMHSLFKRQTGTTTTTTTGTGSAFTEHKLWVIIVVVVGIPR
jgi:hypothetical protein